MTDTVLRHRDLSRLVLVLVSLAAGDLARAEDVVSQNPHEHHLSINRDAPLALIDMTDPRARSPRGLGGARARQPIESYGQVLCDLSRDPQLQPDTLLPVDEEAGSLPASRRPSGLSDARARAACNDAGGMGESSGSTRQAEADWSAARGSQVPSIVPDYAAPPLRRSEALGAYRPDLVPQALRSRRESRDRIQYRLSSDTFLGFDGRVFRIRKRYTGMSPY